MDPRSRGNPHRRFVRRGLASALALGAVCTGAVACKSSNATSTNTNKSLKGSYQIMIIGPYSSGGSESSEPFPEQKNAALAAAKEINDAGGVNGKAIEVEACDSQGSPNKASACASRAVAENLPAVVGVFDTVGDYLAPLAEAKVPVVAPTGLGAEFTSPVAFPLYGGLAPLTGALSLLTSQHFDDVAFVYNNIPTSKAYIQPIIDAGSAATGAKVTAVPFDPHTTDFSAVVAKASKHQAIDLVAFANQSISFISTLRKAGFKTPVSTDTGTIDPKAIKSLGSAAEGLYLSGGFLPSTYTTNPAIAQFVKSVHGIDSGAKLNDGAENAYLSVKLFANLIKGMPSVTAATVTAKLESSTAADTGGLLPPANFSETAPSGKKAFAKLPRIFNFDVVYSRVQHGVIVPLTGKFSDALTGTAVS